jgi:hypothetical protein
MEPSPVAELDQQNLLDGSTGGRIGIFGQTWVFRD